MFKRSHCKLHHQNDPSLKVIPFWRVMAKLDTCVVSSIVNPKSFSVVNKETTTQGLKELWLEIVDP